MILTEYDAKQHIEAEKSESFREGEAIGEARGQERFATLGLKLLQEGKGEVLEKIFTDAQLREELYQKYQIK